MYLYLTLAAAIIFNSLANIIMKFGAARTSDSFSLGKIIFNPLVIGSAASFGISFFSYAYVLSKMNLNVAYPIITSTCFLLVIIFSWLFLKERLLLVQIIGFLLILIGIWLVAKGIK